MARRRILENIEIDSSYLDLTLWPSVLFDSFSDEDRQIYLRRKQAVELYMNTDTPLSQIATETGISPNKLIYFIKRCLLVDSKGGIWGFRALIPQKKIKKYTRTAAPRHSSTNPGAFQLLLNQYPHVKDILDNYYLDREKKRHSASDRVMKVKEIHRKFVEACRLSGISMNDYPFTTSDLGRRSVYRYVNKLKNQFATEASKRYGDDAARQIAGTGIGQKNVPSIIRPFQRVEFDGHQIDLILTIKFRNLDGDEVIQVLERIWLLVITDVATRTTLGHQLCLRSQYSAADVLACIRNAIVPREPKRFTIPGLCYPENGGFHYTAIPETQWAVWGEFCYDNGKANLATIVTNRLQHIVGCHLNAGPVNMPERRPIVERFFGILEENGFHRLPNTTGSSPSDPRRKSPEKQAIKYEMSVDELEQLTSVLISNLNNEPHSGLGYLSPLEAMRQRVVNRGMEPRVIPEDKRNEVDFLSFPTTRTVRGNIRTGKRPYITYEGVDYRNDVLSQAFDLIGETLQIEVNTDDLRYLRAYLKDGSEIGYLTASGKWGITPHNLQMRKQINSLVRKKLIYFTSTDNPIDIFQQYLETKASTSKKARNTLAEQQRYTNEKKGSSHSITTEDKEVSTAHPKKRMQTEIPAMERHKKKTDDLAALREKFRTINL